MDFASHLPALTRGPHLVSAQQQATQKLIPLLCLNQTIELVRPQQESERGGGEAEAVPQVLGLSDEQLSFEWQELYFALEELEAVLNQLENYISQE